MYLLHEEHKAERPCSSDTGVREKSEKIYESLTASYFLVLVPQEVQVP